jgi:hypothetical protein
MFEEGERLSAPERGGGVERPPNPSLRKKTLRLGPKRQKPLTRIEQNENMINLSSRDPVTQRVAQRLLKDQI